MGDSIDGVFAPLVGIRLRLWGGVSGRGRVKFSSEWRASLIGKLELWGKVNWPRNPRIQICKTPLTVTGRCL